MHKGSDGCRSDDYCLGVLMHKGGKICDASNWIKHPYPIMVKGNGVYGPGHASFFYSPDGTELWCAYHGMKEHNENATPAPRYMNIQKITFDEDGFPVVDKPTGYEASLQSPSGEICFSPKMTTIVVKDIDIS